MQNNNHGKTRATIKTYAQQNVIKHKNKKQQPLTTKPQAKQQQQQAQTKHETTN